MLTPRIQGQTLTLFTSQLMDQKMGDVNMAIKINLDVEMAKQKKGLTELANEVDITLANLSILKNNKAKAVRLSTLNAICKALNCQPGDILEYVED